MHLLVLFFIMRPRGRLLLVLPELTLFKYCCYYYYYYYYIVSISVSVQY